MRQILEATETVGSTFMLRGGAPTWNGPQDILARQQVILDVHTGGTWVVQERMPGRIWIDSDIEFSDVGVKAFWASPELEYRLNGGTAGAEAFTTGAWRVV